MKKVFLIAVLLLLIVSPFAAASENRFFTLYERIFGNFFAWTGFASGGPCTDRDRDGFEGGPTNCTPRTPNEYRDCNDNDPLVYPGATEVCNGRDDDCDGYADEGGVCGGPRNCEDMDQDSYSRRDSLYCPSGDDCNDNNAAVNPRATEVCTNGIDDNCNNLIDGQDPACTQLPPPQPSCPDEDGDAYSRHRTNCQSQHTEIDCDDSNANVNPGRNEVCTNGVDDNCNNLIDSQDPACQTSRPRCRDSDNDRYSPTPSLSCAIENLQPDCNDDNANVNPGATEVCTNTIDDNCDGQINTQDQDRDGRSSVCVNDALRDCDDSNPRVYPGAPEVRGNGIDEDCSGADTPSLRATDARVDADGDGKLASSGDCNDNDPTVYTGAPEICDDRKDNDCDGNIDKGTEELFPGMNIGGGDPDADCKDCGNGVCDIAANERVTCKKDCAVTQEPPSENVPPPIEDALTPDEVQLIEEKLGRAGSQASKVEELVKDYYEDTGDPATVPILELIEGLQQTILRFETELQNGVHGRQNAEKKTGAIGEALAAVTSATAEL